MRPGKILFASGVLVAGFLNVAAADSPAAMHYSGAPAPEQFYAGNPNNLTVVRSGDVHALNSGSRLSVLHSTATIDIMPGSGRVRGSGRIIYVHTRPGNEPGSLACWEIVTETFSLSGTSRDVEPASDGQSLMFRGDAEFLVVSHPAHRGMKPCLGGQREVEVFGYRDPKVGFGDDALLVSVADKGRTGGIVSILTPTTSVAPAGQFRNAVVEGREVNGVITFVGPVGRSSGDDGRSAPELLPDNARLRPGQTLHLPQDSGVTIYTPDGRRTRASGGSVVRLRALTRQASVVVSQYALDAGRIEVHTAPVNGISSTLDVACEVRNCSAAGSVQPWDADPAAPQTYLVDVGVSVISADGEALVPKSAAVVAVARPAAPPAQPDTGGKPGMSEKPDVAETSGDVQQPVTKAHKPAHKPDRKAVEKSATKRRVPMRRGGRFRPAGQTPMAVKPAARVAGATVVAIKGLTPLSDNRVAPPLRPVSTAKAVAPVIPEPTIEVLAPEPEVPAPEPEVPAPVALPAVPTPAPELPPVADLSELPDVVEPVAAPEPETEPEPEPEPEPAQPRYSLETIYTTALHPGESAPIAMEALPEGGSLSAVAQYADGCQETYDFRWRFNEDLTNIKPGTPFLVNLNAKLVSVPCATAHDAYIVVTTSDAGQPWQNREVEAPAQIGRDFSSWLAGRVFGKKTDRARTGTIYTQREPVAPNNWFAVNIVLQSDDPKLSQQYEVLYRFVFKSGD